MKPRDTHNCLSISGNQLRSAIRDSLPNSGGLFVAGLTSDTNAVRKNWSIGPMTLCQQPPSGDDYPLLHDWIVLLNLAGSLDTEFQDTDAESLRRRFRPLPGQNLIVFAIGIGSDRQGWLGFHFHAGYTQSIDEVEIVGSHSLRLRRHKKGEASQLQPSPPRWSRLRHALTPPVLDRLSDQHVIVFGASRNGSTVARQLAAFGVRRLSLVDPDVLEEHNFDAMLGGDVQAVGQAKVTALADELTRFRDDMAVTCLPWTATDRRVLEYAPGADIYITAVDHGTPVLLAAKMANRWNKLHIDIGTRVTRNDDGNLDLFGDVRLMFPRQVCASCVGGIADREQAEQELSLPAGVVPLRPPKDFRDQRAGSLVTINAITVSIAIQSLIDHLAGKITTSHWYRTAWTPETGISTEVSPVVSPGDCEICG